MNMPDKNINLKRFNKVAEITLIFWLMKIVATTLGETLGDYISMTLDLGYVIGILITFAFFLVVLFTQLSVKKYIPLVYWLVIIGTTTLGTEISDLIDRTLHLGYAFGSLLLVLCLFISLYIWHKKYNNLEIYPIFEREKEILFWIAVLFSNSLGTAFGDFLSDNLELTYFYGAMITGCERTRFPALTNTRPIKSASRLKARQSRGADKQQADSAARARGAHTVKQPIPLQASFRSRGAAAPRSDSAVGGSRRQNLATVVSRLRYHHPNARSPLRPA